MSPKKFFVWILTITVSFVMIFAVLPIFILSILFTIPQMLEDKAPVSGKVVAVLQLEGTISNVREFLAELYKQANDPKIKAIVLDIDSPGGSVGPSQQIYHAVKKLRREGRPIVSVMSGVAASGGLYSALSSDRILCQPGTLTGSIGVILQVPNFGKLIDKVGVDVLTVKSGDLKDTGSMLRAPTDQEKLFLQQTIDVAYDQFVNAVVESRNLSVEKVKAFADGRVILGSQAVEFGLVDGYGDVYDGAKLALELAGVKLEANELPELYYPTDTMHSLRNFLDSFRRASRAVLSWESVRFQYLINY